jgi:hypothetical protein
MEWTLKKALNRKEELKIKEIYFIMAISAIAGLGIGRYFFPYI